MKLYPNDGCSFFIVKLRICRIFRSEVNTKRNLSMLISKVEYYRIVLSLFLYERGIK